MHILIVGAHGQLGRALQTVFTRKSYNQITLWNRPDHDLTKPRVVDQITTLRPDVVINAAAWTNVDGAELNPEAAYAANSLGPKYLAEGCSRCNAQLVHVSTNEIFAGEPGCYYREYDQPAPGSVYARSKLAGEIAARQALERLYIVRVAWLFGPGGNNFPSKITAAADKMGALRVVADEIGNPTYAPDVAEAIAQLIQLEHFGSYHLVNGGQASRFEFAQAVLQANHRSHIPLTPIAHTEWPRPVLPPRHAVLINQAAAAWGIELRPWQEAVAAYAASQ
ncbi:MAG: dTDP-4-dehydrorhamnose reductase [Chloroflexi bacterium]|nr:dTDP-4-dehydrorhamnose reductase [Chloroflexota bacterium]